MPAQVLTIGRRRFVLFPEREYQRLQKHAQTQRINDTFAQEAMQELRQYRKTGKAVEKKKG